MKRTSHRAEPLSEKDKMLKGYLDKTTKLMESLAPKPLPEGAPLGFFMPQVQKEKWLGTENEWINVTHAERVLLRIVYHPVSPLTHSIKSTATLYFQGARQLESLTLEGEMADKFIEWWREQRK